MVNIVQILQIQQARVIFNPLTVTDIFPICFWFCFILISLPLQDLDFVRKVLKVIMKDPQNWCSRNASFLWRTACWFSGKSSWRSRKFWIFSGIMPNDERSRFASICLPKFGHQTLNCPSIRYIVPAKIFPALPLCQKNWFCGKVRLDDFYPLLRSIASTWIHIDVKRISQACCLHHLKNMEKSFVKHNFGTKNKMGCFFWATLYSTYMYSIIYSL